MLYAKGLLMGASSPISSDDAPKLISESSPGQMSAYYSKITAMGGILETHQELRYRLSLINVFTSGVSPDELGYTLKDL